MEIEIYLDSLFLMNLMINLWILKLLKYKFNLNVKNIRLWTSAIFGAGIYVLTFFVPGTSWLIQPIALMAALPIMVSLILSKRKKHLFFHVLRQGMVYCFVVAGVLRVILLKWKIFAGHEITVFAVLAAAYICAEIGRWCIKKSKQIGRKSICKVVIRSAGTRVTLKALLDTGNSLVEPISKKPVCIIEEELLAHITLENPLFFRAIPYRSVGCEQGVLYGVEIPELKIFCGDLCFVANNVICAGAPHKLSTKNAYQMILHPALLTEENREEMKEDDYVIGERNEKNDIYAGGEGMV